MTGVPLFRLEQVIDRFAEIEARMGAASDPKELASLAREHSRLSPAAKAARELVAMRAAFAEAEGMMAGEDADMAALAQDEYYALKARLPELEGQMQRLLIPRDADDEVSAVLEVRAGTGGDEAALFAGDLFRMYQRYAQLQGWTVEVVSVSEGDAGGFKEIVANITGEGVFGRLRFESGVHRVQRVPATEASGRIHTSAATVAVLPAPEDIAITVRPEDIRIDTMRASGAGGQHVNKTDSAVRITHLPTGIVCTSSEKSQHVNRDKAMTMLKVRLYEREREARHAERAAARKEQVGTGDRSQKIRTWNFPENRVTDHRIGLTLYSLDRIITGDRLGDVIDPLRTDEEARKLTEMADADV
jgi:peptide chain release factor 1